MPEWNAEIELSEGDVRALVGTQFPDVSLDGLAPRCADGRTGRIERIDAVTVLTFRQAQELKAVTHRPAC